MSGQPRPVWEALAPRWEPPPPSFANRDWQPPRPPTVFWQCRCGVEYPRGLVLELGLFDCPCGAVVREPASPGAASAEGNEAVPGADDVKPKRFRRADATGKASTSIRTSASELEEWREAAEANGESFNGWLRRNLGEAVALERAAARHPADAPASRATPIERED